MSLKWCSNLLTTISIIFKGHLCHGPKPVLGHLICPTTWRQIGDIIDSHISWPWKQFFAWKIVLRVILLLPIIFVASVSLVFETWCPSFVSSYYLLRDTASLYWCRQSLSIVVTSLRRFVRFSFRRHRYMSSLELCISFNCCNRTIFLWIK